MMPGEREHRQHLRCIRALIAANGDIALAARRLHWAKAVVWLTLREIDGAFADSETAVTAPPAQVDPQMLVRTLHALDAQGSKG